MEGVVLYTEVLIISVLSPKVLIKEVSFYTLVVSFS